MTRSADHWHHVNREALRVPPEPCTFVTGHPGSISGVFHLQGGWECRVRENGGPGESDDPAPHRQPHRSPLWRKVQYN